jgi:5-methylcytosine-specific restriction endonuclease McrA
MTARYWANREKDLASSKVRYFANRDARLAYVRAWQAKNLPRIKTQRAEYYLLNRAAHSAKMKIYNAANKDKISATNKARYRENHNELLRKQRADREANREEFIEKRRRHYEVNKAHEAASHKLWCLANRERQAAHRQNRRAREQQADGRFTTQDVLDLYARQQGRCAYCQIQFQNNFHVDHVIPLAKGGTNWPSNLALACAFCNLSKGHKLDWEPSLQGIA